MYSDKNTADRYKLEEWIVYSFFFFEIYSIKYRLNKNYSAKPMKIGKSAEFHEFAWQFQEI